MPIEICALTLREAVTLYDELQYKQIYELGEKINLAGGKGTQYIDKAIANYEDIKNPDPYASFRETWEKENLNG